jgi:hypothetical protein
LFIIKKASTKLELLLAVAAAAAAAAISKAWETISAPSFLSFYRRGSHNMYVHTISGSKQGEMWNIFATQYIPTQAELGT